MISTPLAINNSSRYPVADAYHPSVVHISNGWNGHRFWMAQTPYSVGHIEPYQSRFELPCILYSDDGVKWTPIPDNPVDNLSIKDIEEQNYLSDPHLILKNGVLELYYRYTILTDKQLLGNKTLLLRKTSRNGFDWSDREIIADLRDADDVLIWGDQIISPAVIWKDNLYYCWYVDASSYIRERHVRMTTSTDGIHWSKNVLCNLHDADIIPWHLDMQYYDDRFQMLLFDINNQILAHYSSCDAITFTDCRILLRPSHKIRDYYSNSVYRASSVKAKGSIYLYISGHNGERCSIGLWKTIDFKQLKPVRGLDLFTYFREYHIGQKYYLIVLNKSKEYIYSVLKRWGII